MVDEITTTSEIKWDGAQNNMERTEGLGPHLFRLH